MDTFDDSIKELSAEIAELVIRKQRDYGKGNILKCPVGVELGILVRLSDKLNRLTNLLMSGETPKNESLDDNWRDVCGYGLIALMCRSGKFELPLKK
jgi:hypothetical protein